MSAFTVGFALKLGAEVLFYLCFVFLVAAAEMAWPRGRAIDAQRRARAVQFSVLFIVSAVFFGTLVGIWAGQFGPLISGVALLPGAVLVLLAGDFFYYWYHRAQHSIEWLWRIHAVHHSVEELGAGTGYHHLAEGPLKALLVSVPLGLLVSPSYLGPFAVLLSLHGTYIHSSTRLNFGSFAWIIADNRTHRIHHSLEPGHFDKNFGALTMLWDKLFGTAYYPKDEWPAVGLEGRREPVTVREFIGQIDGTRGRAGTL